MIQLLLIFRCCLQALDVLEIQISFVKVNLRDRLHGMQNQSVSDVKGVGAHLYLFQIHTILLKEH